MKKDDNFNMQLADGNNNFPESDDEKFEDFIDDDLYNDDDFLYDEFEEFPKKYYAPSDSMEHYDAETDTWYNLFGQVLRSPDEYDITSEDYYEEGYTPFGDE